MEIQELVDENKELRETLIAMRDMIDDALSIQVLTADGDDQEDEDEELED